MMNRYVLYLLFGMAALPALGQSGYDYYRLPDRNLQYNRLLVRYGGPQIKDRWYVSAESFLRTDRAHINNSINGLLTSDRVAKLDWSVLLGYAIRERWAVEGGYGRMPIHTQVSIPGGRSSLVYRYTNDRNAFVLRGKRLLLSTSGPWLRSGFWLSGGVWMIPNSGRQEGRFELVNYRRRESVDTLRLISQTNVNNRPTALAELGAEYNVRLGGSVDLGFSVRRTWGLGTSITTDVAYTVNSVPMQRAQLVGNGSGMSYGISLRYTIALRRNQSDVLDVRGKQRIK